MAGFRKQADALALGAPILIGSAKHFAVRFVPGYRTEEGFEHAWLHIVIGGRIIGDPMENCVTTTWLIGIQNVLDRVEKAQERLTNAAFSDRSDVELFNLIWKANGRKDPHFAYLPMLDSEVWSNCHISIDETTDAWLLAMVCVRGRLRFLWSGIQAPCPIEDQGVLHVHEMPPATVAEVLRRAILKVNEHRPLVPLLP